MSDQRATRRGFVKLLGGAVGAGLVPMNFLLGCDPAAGHVVRSSGHRPTPESPLTPVGDWYVNINFGPPEPAPQAATWRLVVQGMVDEALTWRLDQLETLDVVEAEVTLECVGNRPGGGLISSALFTGVRLRDVLAFSGVDRQARGLSVLGLDGYPALLPVAVGEQPEPMLAWAMNGEPLRPDHGAPVRLLVPGRYGMYSVKWLDSITLTRTYGSWGALRGLGNVVAGTKAVMSRVDLPADGRTVALGEPTTVSGLAASDGAGVDRVEVRVGEGPWRPAQLVYNTVSDPRSTHLWTLWRFDWTPEQAGSVRLSVRAFEPDGTTQPERAEFPYDSGAIHAVVVDVRG